MMPGEVVIFDRIVVGPCQGLAKVKDVSIAPDPVMLLLGLGMGYLAPGLIGLIPEIGLGAFVFLFFYLVDDFFYRSFTELSRLESVRRPSQLLISLPKTSFMLSIIV